jgi:cytochrome c1
MKVTPMQVFHKGAAMFGQAVIAAALFASVMSSAHAADATEPYDPTITKQMWSFAGPFGKFDEAQLQRGYKVYKEVCSNCHSMKFVSFRNLSQAGGPGFSEDQVKALAATVQVQDGPNDQGEMFMRPGKPSDRFPSPFANPEAAKAANNGAVPPDMSLLAKARSAEKVFPNWIYNALLQYQEYGPDYIYSLMNSYGPEDSKVCDTGYYNTAYIGTKPCFAMPKPLSDGLVTYDDGSPETVQQYSKDVASFLMWAAEPKLEERKETGFKVFIFLIVFSCLLYFTKRRVWAKVAH